MQGIGLDRIDFPRRSPALQQEEGQAQRQPAEARNQHGTPRIDAEMARKPFPDVDVEQQRVERGDRNAHRHHDPPADDSGQRRKDDETGFMGPNERPQPARRLQVTGRGNHLLLRSIAAEKCRRPV
jgi:hypothetical protein